MFIKEEFLWKKAPGTPVVDKTHSDGQFFRAGKDEFLATQTDWLLMSAQGRRLFVRRGANQSCTISTPSSAT
jgi:hypothetical protein